MALFIALTIITVITFIMIMLFESEFSNFKKNDNEQIDWNDFFKKDF